MRVCAQQGTGTLHLLCAASMVCEHCSRTSKRWPPCTAVASAMTRPQSENVTFAASESVGSSTATTTLSCRSDHVTCTPGGTTVRATARAEPFTASSPGCPIQRRAVVAPKVGVTESGGAAVTRV